MTLFLFSLLLALILVWYYYSLSRKYYIERSLYQFRESKHLLLMYMAINAETMDKASYKQLNDMLSMVNDTIRYFTNVHTLKVSFGVIISNTIVSDKKLTPTEQPDSFLTPFFHLYHKGIEYSLEAIPMLRVRIFIEIYKFVLSLLIRAGYSRYKFWIYKLDKFLTAEQHFVDYNYIRKHGEPC